MDPLDLVVKLVEANASGGAKPGVTVTSDVSTFPETIDRSPDPTLEVPLGTVHFNEMTVTGEVRDEDAVTIKLNAAANFATHWDPDVSDLPLTVANCIVLLEDVGGYYNGYQVVEIEAKLDPTAIKMSGTDYYGIQYRINIAGYLHGYVGKLNSTVWVVIGPPGYVEYRYFNDNSEPDASVVPVPGEGFHLWQAVTPSPFAHEGQS